MFPDFPRLFMGTRQSVRSVHQCSCGASFDSTGELLAHAREEHGIWAY
jgi:hypothetical protein